MIRLYTKLQMKVCHLVILEKKQCNLFEEEKILESHYMELPGKINTNGIRNKIVLDADDYPFYRRVTFRHTLIYSRI